MPYLPITCHQEFLWADHGKKLNRLHKYLCNIPTQQNPDPTIILAQNLSSVRFITQFLLDHHYPITYYHEGHTEEQLAKAKDGFYSRRKPILVLSFETNFKQFVQSARFVLVWDFPTSIAHYQQCKTVVNFKDKHSLITSFITNYNKYLLPDLHDYIILKGEQVPPWLSHKLTKRQKSVRFHCSVDPVQYSQEPSKYDASRLDRPGLSNTDYAYPYYKPHSDSVTGSVFSSQLRKAKYPSSCYDLPHSHDLPLGHSDNHTTPVDSILPSNPTVTTTSNVQIKDPMHSSLPFMGETHHEKSSPYSPNDLCDEVAYHVPPSNPYKVWPPSTKDIMGNKELSGNHAGGRLHRTDNPGKPQTKDALQSLPQSSHILEPEDSDSEDSLSLYPDDSVNDTEFEDSLYEFTQSPSTEANILRISDCDPFDEMSSHDDDSVPNLCNLLDDNSSSPTHRFQDVIELDHVVELVKSLIHH